MGIRLFALRSVWDASSGYKQMVYMYDDVGGLVFRQYSVYKLRDKFTTNGRPIVIRGEHTLQSWLKPSLQQIAATSLNSCDDHSRISCVPAICKFGPLIRYDDTI